jgi:hypothetical protein
MQLLWLFLYLKLLKVSMNYYIGLSPPIFKIIKSMDEPLNIGLSSPIFKIIKSMDEP